MNPLFRIPIRLQLIIMVAIVALPAAGIIVYSGIQQNNRAIAEAKKDTQRLVDRIASEQRLLTASTEQLVISLSQLPELKRKDAARTNVFLHQIRRLHPFFSNIFVADAKGYIWASAAPFSSTVNIKDRRYFKNALASGKLASGEFQVSRIVNKPSFNLGYPYRGDNGAIAGVIGVGIDLEDYRVILKSAQLPERANMVLVDYKGLILLSSRSPQENLGRQLDPATFERMQQGPDATTSIEFSIDGGVRQRHRYLSYQKLRIEGERLPYMYVRVGIPVESVHSQVKSEIVSSLSLFTCVLASALFLAWFIGKRSIADRVALLERAAQRLASGELRVKVSELMKGGELGRLGEAFDAMAQQLASREESLATSQRFLNTIIDSEPECVKMLDAEGRFLMINPAGLRMIGAESLKQVKGQSIYPLISPGSRPAFIQLTNDVFRGIPGSLEYEADCLNGRHAWLGTHAVPFRNDEGEIVSLLAITRDITDRKLADQALRQREADLKRAQEIARLGSWSLTMPDRITWSEELYQICGVSPESFTPNLESFLALIHPDDRQAMLSWIEACASYQKPGELVFRVIWPDGSSHYISGRGELVLDEEAGEIHMAGTGQDITERKRAEEELARSESAFRATFEQAAVGMARVALDGRLLQVNQRFCDIVGYTHDELLGMRFQDITHPDDLEADLRYEQAVLGDAGSTSSLEKRYLRKDASVVWINLTLGVVRDPAGVPTYFISVVEDITKRKLAEEALAEKQRLLKDLNLSLAKRVADGIAELRKKDQMLISQGRQAALGEMIGNIAHQWRQPLNTLGLIVQELRLTYSREESYKECLDGGVGRAMSLIQHMSKTIDDFSNYFKPEKEKIQFSVNQAIKKVLNLLEPSFTNLSIEIEVIETSDIFIYGYANEYAQVLLNILLNCRDAFEEYQPQRRRLIRVAVFKENDRSVVTIADNAGGIPEAILDKIFDPYFTTKGPDKGTGIGLYMAKAIIEKNMGGKLTAQNVEEGAEFRIAV